MTNLLPTLKRKELRGERFKRLWMSAGMGLFITFGIGSVLLIPAYFSATTRERNLEIRLESINELIKLKQGASSDVTIRATQDRLGMLDAMFQKTAPSDVLFKTMEEAPAGVTVWQYAYNVSDTQNVVSISGYANNRTTLLAFGESLERTGLFAHVDIPISTLARSENIPFLLTMTLVPRTN
ncbi:MAG: hypothetical protein AAB458_02765 [Patescibacteria group bacterium]